MLSAIIVAGGSSRRMGFDKTFALLGAVPVVAHAIAAFEAAACVDEIVIVGREGRLGEIREMVARFGFRKVQHVIPGGPHRQDSVSTGLRRADANCAYVAVHDAARPLVTPVEISRVFEAAQAHGAAVLAAPVTDTLKRAGDDRVVTESVDRAGLYAMQTPQIFRRALLSEAYRLVQSEKLSITDEVSAVERLQHKVVLVPSAEFNFKITFPADLALAELVLAQRRGQA